MGLKSDYSWDFRVRVRFRVRVYVRDMVRAMPAGRFLGPDVLLFLFRATECVAMNLIEPYLLQFLLSHTFLEQTK